MCKACIKPVCVASCVRKPSDGRCRFKDDFPSAGQIHMHVFRAVKVADGTGIVSDFPVCPYAKTRTDIVVFPCVCFLAVGIKPYTGVKCGNLAVEPECNCAFGMGAKSSLGCCLVPSGDEWIAVHAGFRPHLLAEAASSGGKVEFVYIFYAC